MCALVAQTTVLSDSYANADIKICRSGSECMAASDNSSSNDATGSADAVIATDEHESTQRFSLDEYSHDDEFVTPDKLELVDWEEIWQACFDESFGQMGITPNFACSDQGCATNARCVAGAPAVRHMCYVDACGDAGCRGCPSWVAEILKHIVVKTWCSYVCVQTGTSPPKTVAIGAGAVSSFKGVFVGPFCVSY